MTAVFVTATGTDIGKTFVTAGLIRHFRAGGRTVEAIKPVVSGFDPQTWQKANAESDPAVLLAALGRPITLAEAERISPWRFVAPLSPHMAARREGRAIAFQEVVDFCRKAMAARRGTLLIEGVGGILVPLDDHRSVLDLMSVLRIPILLVAGSYVGTVSHTLTALEVLVRRNLNVAGVVVSESETSAATLEDTMTTLQGFADSIDVVGIPRLAPGAYDEAAFARVAELI
jgi:dethiobiotin synthetase